MGRPKEPVDLLLAKGKTHLTKEEIAERRANEIEVPFKNVKPPKYLSKEQKKEFKRLAKMLLSINLLSELDADTLARYVISQDLYLKYTKKLINCNYEAERDLFNMQDKAFKQAQSSARELGLTVTSRCKLNVPQEMTDSEDDEL